MQRQASKRLKSRLLLLLAVAGFTTCLINHCFMRHGLASDFPQTMEYVVQPGDTLWHIAKNYVPARTDIRAFIHQMRTVNELPSPLIQPGQVLVIPIR